MFWSPKHSRVHHIFIRSTENSGGRGNPFSPIDVNTFRTTNFRSQSAMRGAEFHGNSPRDGPTRIRSIQNLRHCSLNRNVFNIYVEFQVWVLHGERDSHVDKIKVKKKLKKNYICHSFRVKLVYFHKLYIN